MNTFVKNVLSAIIAASIVGNATMLFRFSERLTKIEDRLEYLTHHNLAKN